MDREARVNKDRRVKWTEANQEQSDNRFNRTGKVTVVRNEAKEVKEDEFFTAIWKTLENLFTKRN